MAPSHFVVIPNLDFWLDRFLVFGFWSTVLGAIFVHHTPDTRTVNIVGEIRVDPLSESSNTGTF